MNSQLFESRKTNLTSEIESFSLEALLPNNALFRRTAGLGRAFMGGGAAASRFSRSAFRRW